jgi:hypothetical protein
VINCYYVVQLKMAQMEKGNPKCTRMSWRIIGAAVNFVKRRRRKPSS